MIQLQLFSIIQHCRAAKITEYLVLIGNYDHCTCFGTAIENGLKYHLKTAIAGGDLPWLQIAVLRNVENYIIQLVRDTIIQQEIFTCRCGIPKAVTDIKAEGLAFYDAVSITQYQVLSYVHTPRPQSRVAKSF